MSQWFLSELRAIAAPTELARYALDMANQRVSLIERTLGGWKNRGEAIHGEPDFENRLQAMLGRVARRYGAEAPVDILLPPELTLERVETFPAEARRNLRDEVWWRLESMTPYQAEDLCYDCTIVGVEPKTGFLDVNVVIAPRDIVDEALDYAREWGFSPQRVSTSAPVEGFPHGPVFIEAANQRKETRSLKRLTAGLAAAATLLAVVGVGRAVLERLDIADALEARAAALDEKLAGELATRESALDLLARAGKPDERTRSRRSAASWLKALEEATPEDVVIERLTLVGDRLRIEGTGANADAALAALDQSDAFEGARHAAPILAGPSVDGAPRERFAIEARLAPPRTEEPPAAEREARQGGDQGRDGGRDAAVNAERDS